jgi:response regulator of citrate/malate metabolism
MKESISYHNTTREKKTKELKGKAKSQEKCIHTALILFGKKTASELWTELYKNTNTPLTSVRRALSNLAYEERIEKLAEKKIGMFGRPEHYYSLISTKE